MIFHEVYSCYYGAVTKAIRAAIKGELTGTALKRIIDETAFAESFLEIIPALQEQRWQLIDKNWRTPVRHAPTMPVSQLQKRWMKAVTLDPRFRLFGIEPAGLEGVVPLFTPEDYVVFDKYSDGDPFEDEAYIAHFQTILRAIREGKCLNIRYSSSKGTVKNITCKPSGLEYSEKDDKFRLIVGNRCNGSINLQRVERCEILEYTKTIQSRPRTSARQNITFILQNERNALERAMLHFAHFEKEAERISEKSCRVMLRYDGDDETELLIRILSFGPLIKVVAPESFVELIRDRLIKQKSCGL